jgi:hypothetical protein
MTLPFMTPPQLSPQAALKLLEAAKLPQGRLAGHPAWSTPTPATKSRGTYRGFQALTLHYAQLSFEHPLPVANSVNLNQT